MTAAIADERQDAGYDVVVVGGGAAGLSAALALGRARRTVLVVDAGAPRNAAAGHVHNYLGREGAPPGELLAAGRAEVAAYGVRIGTGTVTSVERYPGGAEDDPGGLRFVVQIADGRSVPARRLLVTTGLVDELPDLPGLAGRWGRDVLHCPYCHGWEVRDQALGVLATGPMAVHQALLFRQWSADVLLFRHTGPASSERELEQLAARGIRVVDGEVAGLEITDDRLSGVRLRSGAVVAREAVVVAPRFTARAEVLASLGLETTQLQVDGHVVGSYVAADPTGATSVPGVWVAGNVADLRAQVISSAAAGLGAAAAVNADLVADDTAAAVAAARARRPGPGGAAQAWEDRYRTREQVWSGRPNAVLVEVVGQLPAGTALELGCGEGADSVWLALRGWTVTAVDVAGTALERAAKAAAAAGVGDRIDWQRHDLARDLPAGTFDLVSAQFLHSPGDFPRERVLRAAARAVAPGGLLLVVGHAAPPPWHRHDNADPDLPTPQETLAALDLGPGWDVERLDTPSRAATGPDGSAATLVDSVVALRRRR